MPPDDPTEWTPIALRWENGGPMIDWRRMTGRRFIEPFFEQTVHKHQQETPSANRTTSAETLLSAAPPERQPTGFIFHASRSGSTLVAQMLAASPRNVVLSEPAVVNQVLRPRPPDAISVEDHVRLVRAIIGALSRSADPLTQNCFIKFSSPAISKMALIRRALPRIPWVFLYREPLEIVGAQLRLSGERLPPGIVDGGLLDGDPARLAAMPPSEFWSRVLAARLCDALRFHEPGMSSLMNYAELPDAALAPMLRFFAVSCSPDEIAMMREAALWDAKMPCRRFTSDSDEKRRAVPIGAHSLVERLAMPHYRRLEELRGAQ